MAKAPKARIIYGECDSKVLEPQAAVFEKAGYSVEKLLGRKAVEQALRGASFDVVVLGHTMTKDDRHHLPYMARKANPVCRILVLHASGRHHEVDLAIDSRLGEQAVLEAIANLLAQEPVSTR
jgi:hypothetical protein